MIAGQAGRMTGTALATVALAIILTSSADGEVPVAATRFGISIDGVEIASFSELQGITTKVDVIELRDVTSSSRKLSTWHEEGRRDGRAAAARDIELVGYDTRDRMVVKYRLKKAWPSRIKGERRADDGDVLVETVTIVYESLQRVSP